MKPSSGIRTLLSVFLLLSCLAGPVAAQAGPGTGGIMGQVFSQESGNPIPGAQIQVENTTRGSVAGIEGRYQMDGIPAGEISVRVSMLGYAPTLVTGISLAAGATVRLDITLTRQALELAGVVVTAQQERGSAVNLLQEQRHAAGVVNAISAEQISRSPDGDAAAAMRRVSGVTVQDGKYVFVRGLGERYTTSSLNGARIPSPDPERKMVPLDLFPAGLLQSVATTKTFTPDLPGDFSGGSVDIRTPEFPANRTYGFSFSSGYHPDITGRTVLGGPSEGREWLAFGTGPRTLPDAARNFSGNVTRGREVNEVVNSFRNNWSVQERSGRLPASLGGTVAGSSPLFGHTLGYLGSLTYSHGQEVKLEQRRARAGTGGTEMDRYDGQEGSTSILWGGLANSSLLLGSHSQLHFNNTFSRSADNQARIESGTDENTRSAVQIERLTYIERMVRSHQLAGEHLVGLRHRIDWSLNGSAVSRSEPDRSEFVTWLDPEVPIWFKDFEGAVRTFGSLEEGAQEASIGYGFTFGRDPGNPGRIRVGVNHRRTDREAVSQGFRIQPFDWSPSDPRWQAPPEELFDGRYAGDSDELFLLSRELSGGTYDANDRLNAGFAMAEVNATSRLRLIGGVRVESYRLELRSENQLGQSRQVEKDYLDLLPSLAATLSLREGQQLRASVSRTLARPEYREVAPITYREVLGGEQVIGNVELERTRIRNLDLRWEWYPRPGEVLSVAVFSKRFENPIEQRYLARSGTNTRTFENADHATNHGIELEANRRLGDLHPALEPLSIFSNVTLMRSRVHTGREGDVERPMVGQAPFVVNTGVTWADPFGGVSTTLLYNVVGKRIVNARASGTQVDDITDRPRHLVDLSLRFPFVGNASGKLDLKNLLDSPHEVVQGPIVREFHRSGRSVSFGISWLW